MTHKNNAITIKPKTYEKLCETLKSINGAENITSNNLIFVVTNLMSVIGKYTDINGIQKKEIVINFINNSINNSNLNSDDKFVLNSIVSNVVPGAIDMLVEVAKKKYIIKRVKSCFRSIRKYKYN